MTSSPNVSSNLSIRRVLGKSASWRAVTMPISILCGFLNTWLAIGYVGAGPFSAILVIVGLIQFLPFADFGVGAAVLNVMSRGAIDHVTIERTLVSAQRVLTLSAFGIALLAIALGLGGTWPTILGAGTRQVDNVSFVATLFLCGYAASVVFQIGQRILMGRGLNHWSIVLSTFSAVIALTVTTCAVVFHLSIAVLALSSVIGLFVSGVVASLVSLKGTQSSYLRVLGMAFRPWRYKGLPIGGMAWPMLVVTLGLAIALQSNRVIVSHFGTPRELAELTVSYQIYAQAWVAVSSTFVTFWQHFNKLRDASSLSDTTVYFWRTVRTISVTAVVLSVLLGVGVIIGSDWLSHGESPAPVSLAIALAFLLLIQTVHYPGGTFLTSARGLMFQAACVVLMLVVCVPASIVGTIFLGSAGPIWASAGSVLLFQLIPTWIYIVRASKRDEPTSATRSETAV